MRLRRLYLNGNQLTGPVPAELAGLAALRRVWLQDNELSGPIPAELGNLAHLDQIFLGGTNALSGCLPAVWQEMETLGDDLDALELEFCLAP